LLIIKKKRIFVERLVAVKYITQAIYIINFTKITTMKKISSLVLLMSFIMIGFTSCSKNDGGGATTSSLNANAQTVSSAMSIEFTAVQTGDGTITTLTYTVGSVTQTVTNPTLPWSISVDATAGNNISMTATAITTNGSVNIAFDGSNGGETVHGSDSCSTSGN
jgi:hypothetical protein